MPIVPGYKKKGEYLVPAWKEMQPAGEFGAGPLSEEVRALLEGPSSLRELFTMREYLGKRQVYLVWAEAKVAEAQWLLQRVFGFVATGQKRRILDVIRLMKQAQAVVAPMIFRHPWALALLPKLQKIESMANMGLMMGNPGQAMDALRTEGQSLLAETAKIREERMEISGLVPLVDQEISKIIRFITSRREKEDFAHQVFLLRKKLEGWKPEQWIAPVPQVTSEGFALMAKSFGREAVESYKAKQAQRKERTR